MRVVLRCDGESVEVEVVDDRGVILASGHTARGKVEELIEPERMNPRILAVSCWGGR